MPFAGDLDHRLEDYHILSTSRCGLKCDAIHCRFLRPANGDTFLVLAVRGTEPSRPKLNYRCRKQTKNITRSKVLTCCDRNNFAGLCGDEGFVNKALQFGITPSVGRIFRWAATMPALLAATCNLLFSDGIGGKNKLRPNQSVRQDICNGEGNSHGIVVFPCSSLGALSVTDGMSASG